MGLFGEETYWIVTGLVFPQGNHYYAMGISKLRVAGNQGHPFIGGGKGPALSRGARQHVLATLAQEDSMSHPIVE